jgi:hypothetical protein
MLKVEAQVNLDRRMSLAVVGHIYGVNDLVCFFTKMKTREAVKVSPQVRVKNVFCK